MREKCDLLLSHLRAPFDPSRRRNARGALVFASIERRGVKIFALFCRTAFEEMGILARRLRVFCVNFSLSCVVIAREEERSEKSSKKRKQNTRFENKILTVCLSRLLLLFLFNSKKTTTENAGKTAAMIAAGAGHVDVLKAMQRGPSMLDLKAADGGTPAMSAAVHGYKEVLDYLISKKVDLNAQDEDGWTALHFAVMANAASSVKALLAAGAKTDIKNSDGDTAEMLAQGSKAGIKKLFGKGGSSKRLDGVKEGKKGCVVM